MVTTKANDKAKQLLRIGVAAAGITLISGCSAHTVHRPEIPSKRTVAIYTFDNGHLKQKLIKIDTSDNDSN